MLLSEKGLSALKCTSRLLFFKKIKKDMIAGRRLLHASVEEVDNTSVSVSLPKRSGQECPTEHLMGNTVPIHQKISEKLGGSIWRFSEECTDPHRGVRALHDRTLALVCCARCQFPSHACSIPEVK